MEVGQVICGKYRLLRLLGDGGMGTVYEAQHEMLGTRVAIKVLHPELTRRPGLGERFLQEARVVAQIKSHNVVRVIDVDRTPEGVAYIVMELLEGEPMSSLLERERKVAIPLACDYTIQILCALEAAHALGVVHRDLKPENVFITFASGKPILKLIDFGIAKLRSSDPGAKNLTVAGVLMGTAEYMAPEQAHSADKVDARSDIYAVGVMLYEMISGTRPVMGSDARVIALKVERGEVQPLVHAAPDVPREVAGLVHRAMAARPELRFASATEMRLALEGTLTGKRPPTVQLPQLDQAGSGTVMGAPADAVLRIDARLMAMPAGTGTLPANLEPPRHGTHAGGAPMMPAPAMTHDHAPHRFPGAPGRRRKSRAPLIGLAALAVVALGGGGAAYYNYYWMVPDALPPAPIAFTAPAATPAASTPGTLTAAPVPTNDPLMPLGTSTVRPVALPSPHPNPSATGPKPGPGPGPPPDVPTLPPFPTAFPSTFPNPFPTGSSGMPPIFTLPTSFPSIFPPIFPGQPVPAPSAPPGN